MTITHRERVRKALNHEASDRVPVDFGGSHETGIQADAYAALLKHLGFEPEVPERWERGEEATLTPSEKVLRRFEIDVRGIDARIGGVDARRQVDLNTAVDGWGVVWKRGDTSLPYINLQGPLQGLEEPSPSDVESLPWPAGGYQEDVAGLREHLWQLRAETDYALVVRLRNVGTFYLAQRLRGFAEYLEDLLLNPVFAEALQDRATDMACAFARAVLGEVGDLVDGVSFGDDLGTQTQTLMNPDLYRRLVKPYHARFVGTMHDCTDAKVILHSCGAIRPLLGDLIDCGVDVINPVQVNAAGMHPADLKREFGQDLCFWGGIDTQRILPFASPAEVAEEVRQRINDLGQRGGYVLTAVHNIRAEVPPENVAAMYDTATSLTTSPG